MGRNVRRSYKRDRLRERVRSQGLPCHICGCPIDYSLPAGHPWSFELDEVFPVGKLPPELRKAAASDPNNCLPAHRRCNQRKSDKIVTDARKHAKPTKPIKTSREW